MAAVDKPEDAGGRARGSFLQRHGAKILVSVLLGAGLAWLLARGGLPLLPPASAFGAVRTWVVPVYVGTLVLVHVFRAVRWRHLLRPLGEVPVRSVIAVSWIAFGVIVMSPFRSGEVVRPYLITKRGPVRLWEATGTIGAERVIDGLMLSVILLVALQVAPALSPLPDHVGALRVPVAAVPGAAYVAFGIFVAAFLTMALFFWRRDAMRRLTHAVLGIVSHRLADLLAGVVERVAEGLRFLPSLRHLVPFLLETVIYWMLNASGIWFLGWGCGLEGFTFAQACVTMGTIGIGILVPAGPGYFGTFQLSTYMALAMFLPEAAVRGPGAAFVFLIYVTQVGWHLLAMPIALLIDPAVRLGGALEGAERSAVRAASRPG